MFMIQALQQMQQQQNQFMQAQAEAQAEALAAIAEKVSGNSETTNNNRNNKSRAKGRHPEKLERDVDYASLLQWEKRGICIQSAIILIHYKISSKLRYCLAFLQRNC